MLSVIVLSLSVVSISISISITYILLIIIYLIGFGPECFLNTLKSGPDPLPKKAGLPACLKKQKQSNDTIKSREVGTDGIFLGREIYVRLCLCLALFFRIIFAAREKNSTREAKTYYIAHTFYPWF